MKEIASHQKINIGIIRKFIALLMGMMLASVFISVPVFATGGGAATNNIDRFSYNLPGMCVYSYLEANSDGTLTRIEFDDVNKKIVIENYNENYELINTKTITPEMDLFGTYYNDGTYRYVCYGQKNEEEVSGFETVKIVKYSKSWDKLKEGTLTFGVEPFDSGSACITVKNGILRLYRSTSTKKDDLGMNHQCASSYRFSADTLQYLGQDSGNSDFFAAHSFNQVMIKDPNDLSSYVYAASHSDSNPERGIIISRADENDPAEPKKDVLVRAAFGEKGDNITGVMVSDIDVGETNVLAAGSAVDYGENIDRTGPQNIYIWSIDKNNFTSENVTEKKLTAYTPTGKYGSGNPHMVKIGDNRWLVIWAVRCANATHIGHSVHEYKWLEETNEINFTTIDENGNMLTPIRSMEGYLSDCKPVMYNGKVVWYTTYNSAPVFYEIDPNDFTTTGHKTTIHFDPNGGTVEPEKKVYQYTEGSTTKWTYPTPQRENGYEFDGWYSKLNDWNNSYDDGEVPDQETLENGTPIDTYTKTLHAFWKIELNETNFPNAKFRNYISTNFDKDGNGYLSEKERMDVKTIKISNDSVTSLEGIRFFENLSNLDCHSCSLTGLDVSSNKKLKKLNCSYNSISSLDLSENKVLQEVDCSNGELTTLGLPAGGTLGKLYCEENKLTALDLTGLTGLKYLTCSNNELASLDTAGNEDLVDLDCRKNYITSVNVSRSSALQEFYISENSLRNIDLSKNSALIKLHISKNRLTALDVSKSESLKTLNCANNRLKVLDLSNNASLTTLDASNNYLTGLDISGTGITSQSDAVCSGNLLAIKPVHYLQYDVSELQGFDPSKVSQMNNAEIDGDSLEIDESMPGTISYTYDIGKGFSEQFTININYASMLKKVERQEPTCEAEGYEAYFTSPDGNTLYSDRRGEHVIENPVVIPKVPHDLVKTEAKDPACEKEGNTEYYTCSVCNKLFSDAEGTNRIMKKDTVIPATGHTWDEGTVTQEPDCTTAGNKRYTCTVCEKTRDESISAIGHDLEKVDGIPATCTEEGRKDYYKCKRCEKKYLDAEGTTEATDSDLIINKTKHKMTKIDGVPATCTEEGRATYYKCENCGKWSFSAMGTGDGLTEDDIRIPATGHDLVEHEGTSSCTEPGTITYWSCNTCGKLFDSVAADHEITENDIHTEATGHSFNDGVITKQPTCEEDGIMLFTCGNCGLTEERIIEKTGHDMTEVPMKDSTCSEEGNTKYFLCNTCGKLYKDKDGKTETSLEEVLIPKKDHTWNDGEVIKEATAEENGLVRYTCIACGETKDVIITATGHNLTFVEQVDPTCTEEGCASHYVCSDCDNLFADENGTEKVTLESLVLKPLGHKNGEWKEVVKPTCVSEGERVRLCERCGEEIEETRETVPMTAHSYDSGKVIREATCSAEGYKKKTCSVCGREVTETIPKKDHKWNTSYTVDKAATYASAGVKSIHCSVCDAKKPGSEVTIPKLTVSKASLSKVSAAKKGFKAKWKKVSGVNGYEIQYALKKNFKKAKTVKIAKSSVTSKKVSKLKVKKKYFVRIRTYKTVSGKKYYSTWSKVKKVKTKK